MRRATVLKRLGFLVFATACFPVSVTPANLVPIRPTEVALSVSKDAAFERSMAAFLSSGLRVDQANKEAGIIKSAGMMGDIVTVGGLFPVVSQSEYFFRVNIVATDSGSKVYVSASGRAHTTSSGKSETTPESEMYECQKYNVPGAGSAYEKCQESMTKFRAKVDSLAMRIKSGS